MFCFYGVKRPWSAFTPTLLLTHGETEDHGGEMACPRAERLWADGWIDLFSVPFLLGIL